MEQKPPRILQAKTSFHTIIGFLSVTSLIQNLLNNLWVLLELGLLPWRQINLTFLNYSGWLAGWLAGKELIIRLAQSSWGWSWN